MDGILSQWLRAVIFACIACSIALLITPDGRVKKAMRILCAAVMCSAVISPIVGFDFDVYAKAAAKYQTDARQYAEQGEQYSKNLNRSIIEEECSAYILDKAAELGADIDEAVVTALWSSDGYWYPYEVSIKSSSFGAREQRLSEYIQAKLGISAEKQKWSADSDAG